MYNTCDKCGEAVNPDNDCAGLDLELTGDIAMIFAQSRHLLPTENCEGSPSRAQYLPGQKKDSRSEYSYRGMGYQKRIREAYARMLVATSW